MKLLAITDLAIPDVKVIRFQRFRDHRGYFTEPFRHSDIEGQERLTGLRQMPIVQTNESYSHAGTVRGLHFQWNPYMGKLVRTLYGRMIDMVLDIRAGSPTQGKAIAYDMPTDPGAEWAEWIWVPPGFAHGNFFPADTLIEYYCTGEYSPGCEAGVSPLAPDIDWSLCNRDLKADFDGIVAAGSLISEKDKNGLTLAQWLADERSKNFVYGNC
jgi:dTDP-4-dehydrorhamnose 3,5-epimerase